MNILIAIYIASIIVSLTGLYITRGLRCQPSSDGWYFFCVASFIPLACTLVAFICALVIIDNWDEVREKYSHITILGKTKEERDDINKAKETMKEKIEAAKSCYKRDLDNIKLRKSRSRALNDLGLSESDLENLKGMRK